MWFERLTNYLLKNRWQTVGLVFIVTFLPIIGIVGILAAVLVTLRRSVLDGALVTLAATLPYLASFAFPGQHVDPELPLFIWAAVGVAVSSNVLTWVFAVMLRRGVSWSDILQIAALFGVLVISSLHMAFPDIANWWGTQLLQYYQQTQHAIDNVMHTAATAPSDTQLETIKITQQFATGVMTTGILMNAILQLAVGRWWETIVFSRGMLRRELHNIRLSRLAGLLFVLSLVLAYMGNVVVLDMMPVVYMLFAGAGLSLVHYTFGMMVSTAKWFWLGLLYVVLLFSLPGSLVMLSALALVDIGFDVRKRFKKI